jgi:hypothetical protein
MLTNIFTGLAFDICTEHNDEHSIFEMTATKCITSLVELSNSIVNRPLIEAVAEMFIRSV